MIVKFFLVNELSFWLRNNSQHVFFLLENYVEMKDLKLVVIDSQRFLKLELEIISLVTKIINIFCSNKNILSEHKRHSYKVLRVKWTVFLHPG